MAQDPQQLSIRKPDVKFGKEVAKDFLFEPGWLNLNHGSFGTFPRVVQQAMRSIQERTEAAPDRFCRYEYPRLLDASRAAMAELLGVPVDTVVYTPNATTGVNTVLRNLDYVEGDVILYFAPCIYGSCEKTVKYVCETTPARHVVLPMAWPGSHAQILADFEAAVSRLKAEGRTARLAIFDTVVSMPGVRLPYEGLVALCRKHGVLSLVDGAHGVGMLDAATDLRLTELDPDFFVSNAHKWLLVPRGCAVLYVPVRNQALVRTTLPTSHGFAPRDGGAIVSPLPAKKGAQAKSPFVVNFEFVGTVDNAPYLCVPEAIRYRRERLGGEERIIAYIKGLAKRAGEIVAAILGTDTIGHGDVDFERCGFSNVRLPLEAAEVAKEAEVQTNAVGGLVRDYMCEVLMEEHKTFMAFIYLEGKWWVRLSAAVYLEEDDFKRGGELLKDVCDGINRGGWYKQ